MDTSASATKTGGDVEGAADSEAACQITQGLLCHLADIAASCKPTAVFVYADALGGQKVPLPQPLRDKTCYVTKTEAEDRCQEELGRQYLRVPNVPMTRSGQVKIAVFLALSRGLLRQGDRVLFLLGVAGRGTIDTLMVLQVGRELEMVAPAGNGSASPAHTRPEVVERVVDVAAEISTQGREGKPVGALFVVGDTDRVLPLTRQLILNPFRGYDEKDRNILDPSLVETVKELATIDGAFIVRGDGIIESCGTYLKVTSQEEFEMPRGLGARHHAAAAITAVTDSMAVTVSESTGTVTIFRGGRIVTELEKPRAAPAGRLPLPA